MLVVGGWVVAGPFFSSELIIGPGPGPGPELDNRRGFEGVFFCP